MANLPSWVAPMTKPAQGLQNLAQTYTQPHNARTGGWDGQGPNPNQPLQHPVQHPMQQPQQPQNQSQNPLQNPPQNPQTGLQGLESRISPELMQLMQPFVGMMQGQGGGMKGLLGFQPVEHDPFKPNQQQTNTGGGGGLYGQ